MSSLFGGKPRMPTQVVQPAAPVSQKDVEPNRDEVLRRLAALRKGQMATAQLTEPNVRRRTLGAGGVTV